MVFEKTEVWTFDHPTADQALSFSSAFWSQRGYAVQSTGPASFRGRSFHSTLGIHRVVEVMVGPSGGGSTIHLHFRADVRADVAAGGAVLAVLLLPVAVVGAALSWHEYEEDWSRERWAYWNYLVGPGGARPTAAMSTQFPAEKAPLQSPAAPPLGQGPQGQPTPAKFCPACGTGVSGAGKFCSACGAAIP